MLHEFITSNRTELIRRCSAKVSLRRPSQPGDLPSAHGVPIFLEQLTKTLRLERAPNHVEGDAERRSELSNTAIRHGRELLQRGFTVDQVVHAYGDICQAITELASEFGKPIKLTEFRTLNRCLDDAIADAVAEYSFGKNRIVAEQGMVALNERLGFLAHELRHHIDTAAAVLLAHRSEKALMDGTTADKLDHSLIELRSLVDRSLADVRVSAGMTAHKQRLSVAELIAEITLSSSLEARTRDCTLVVSAVDPALHIQADWHLLSAALGNLLQNAFKFTHLGSDISLSAYACGGRILIDVADRCGGLPQDMGADMFAPFSQNHGDKSGVGLGLSISQHSVEANDGLLRVRNIEGFGCIFTIDLPLL